MPRAADALVEWMLALPGNEDVRIVNPLVAETNDGSLNDIRGRHVGREEVFAALKSAKGGEVEEGSVGAGTGTVAFGFKGGIGTSSRVVPTKFGGYTVGVLVQTNFGGVLTMNGAPVGRELGRYYLKEELEPPREAGAKARARLTPNSNSDSDLNSDRADGSVIVVIATDAPLDARNLRRLAARAMLGLARTGSPSTNGSGDYCIAFTTAPRPARQARRHVAARASSCSLTTRCRRSSSRASRRPRRPSTTLCSARRRSRAAAARASRRCPSSGPSRF